MQAKYDTSLAIWLKNFELNIERNRQLAFSKNMYVSYIIDEEPRIDMLNLRDVKAVGSDCFLIFFIDKREELHNVMLNGSKASLIVYFPLTKEKYVFRGVVDGSAISKGNMVDYWNTHFSEEDKKIFKREDPKMPKSQREEDYNQQRVDDIPENFRVLSIKVREVSHTVLKMPEVIADARNPVFESEFKPYKKEKKFRFISSGEGQWKFEELNP